MPDALAPDAPGSFYPSSSNVDIGFFTWEMATGVVVCDPVTYRMHGMPEQQAATMDAFLSRVPAAELDQVKAAMGRMAQTCGDYQIEYRVLGEDGTLRSMEARGRVAPGEDGKPARMMGLVTDTTAVRARRDARDRRLRDLADRARRTRDFTIALTKAATVHEIVAAAREGLRAYGADSFLLIGQVDGRLGALAQCGFAEECVRIITGFDSVQQTPVSQAIHWRSPVYLGSPEALTANYPHLADVAARCTQRAWVALPVFDAGGNIGACLLGFPDSHEFPAEERALLYAASGLLAQSVERARMFETHRTVANELQRGMLPRAIAHAPGLSIATRYATATSGVEIGGDFYDVVQLAHGRVALVIGDVEGHNLLAASLMGRLRTAVHAYAREGHGASEVMSRANRWLADLNSDPDLALFATCCVVAVDPVAGELAVCRAGHPPPVLAPPGESPRILDCDPGLPLGVDAEATYSTSQIRVPPGSVLALATDGLLEADAADDYNLGHLASVLAQYRTDDLEELATTVLSESRSATRHSDDVALLLARIEGGRPTAGRSR